MKDMNIEYLEAFMYVVHLESIHKAADALYLSQPTITARIKTLERDLGTQLFLRKGRSMILTEEGKAFIPYAERIIRTYRQGKNLFKKENRKNEIVIGANIITSQYFLPFALPLLKKANPELRFKLISASNEILLEKLLQNQIDIAFMRDTPHRGIHKQELLDNSVRLVVFPGHPFERQNGVTVQQLAAEPLVFFECGAFDWNRVYKLFEVSKLEPRIEFLVDHLAVAKSFIRSGNGIGFLPYLSIKQELERGELIEIDISNIIQINQPIIAAYLENSFDYSKIWNDILITVEMFNEGRQREKQLAR